MLLTCVMGVDRGFIRTRDKYVSLTVNLVSELEIKYCKLLITVARFM